jgi:hypothetical protein
MPFVAGLGRRQSFAVTKARRPLPKPPTFRPTGETRLTNLERELASVVERGFDKVPSNAFLALVTDPEDQTYRRAVDEALESVQDDIADVLHRQLVATGRQATDELKTELATLFRQMYKAEKPTVHQVVANFAFNVDSQDALDYARREAATLVTNMGTEQVSAMRDLIATSRGANQTRRQTSSAIRGLLETVSPGTDAGRLVASTVGANVNGLTVRYERAVLNHANREAARLADAGITGRKALKEVKDSSNAYAHRLRQARSRTIARTEIVRAAEAGRQESWNQAAKQGLIDPKVATKTWSTGPYDVCPICQGLQATSVPVKGTWPNNIKHPPAHPNCRCTMVLNTYPPATPPQAVGSGTVDDPYRIIHDDDIPNLDDYPPLTGTEVAPPDLSGPRRAEGQPAPRAPKPTKPKPATPARGTGIGDKVPFDDLRSRLDTISDDVDTIGVRLVDEAKIKTAGYEATVTKEGEEVLDLVEEAGRRVEARADEILRAGGHKTMDEAAAQYDEAAEVLRKSQTDYATHTFDEFQDLAASKGLPMTPDEIALGPDAGRLQWAERVKSMPPAEVRRKLKLKAGDSLAPNRLMDEVLKGGKQTAEKKRLKALVDAARDGLEKTTTELAGHAKVQADAVRQALKEVREDFGTGVFDVEIKEFGAPLKKRIGSALDTTQQSMPKSWVDNINESGVKVQGTPSRPVFRRSTNTVHVSLHDDMVATTLHEVTHVAETTTNRVAQVNEAFYLRQTRGQRARVLYGVEGQPGSEVVIDDDFGDAYAGKWYGQGRDMPQAGNFETLTRGMESLFGRDVMSGPFFIRGAFRRHVLGVLGLL